MTYQITSTSGRSAMTKGMSLTDDGILTGDTYQYRDIIKAYWGGEWDAAGKFWRVDAAAVISTINAKKIGKLAVLHIEAQPESRSHSHGDNKPCPHCGTYCYGDCRSH
jgi:hypothetical protein